MFSIAQRDSVYTFLFDSCQFVLIRLHLLYWCIYLSSTHISMCCGSLNYDIYELKKMSYFFILNIFCYKCNMIMH